MRLKIDTRKLAHYLAEHFEFSFSRPFDDLPDYVQEHWTEIADEMALDLIEKEIITGD